MNSEKGQALPIAIMALALGTLVITPFLSHASSSLIGSGVHKQVIMEQDAADAGVEHAIWSLTSGDLAAQMPEPGDSVTYQLGEAVNGITPVVTVTANQTAVTAGDTGGAVIDTLEFDTADGNTPAIIHISGNVYAIAYRGTGDDGFLKTVSVAADGAISPTIISTLEFDTASGYEPAIIHISGNVYAIAYRGSGSDGFLKTVTIATTGAISPTIISTLEFDTADGFEPNIIQISGNVYAIVYRGSKNNGFLKTVTIAADGTISPAVIATLAFSSSLYTPDITPVSGGVYAVVGRGSNNDGILRVIEIAANGDIANPDIITFVFDNGYGYEPVITHVSGDIYAIAYSGVNSDGFVITVEITTQGGTSSSAYKIVSTAGDSTIRAFVNIVSDNVSDNISIISWQMK